MTATARQASLTLSRRLFFQVATPAVLVGVLLCGACLASAWYINHLQANLAHILADHVASMRAAQQLEINVRQLRFHCFLYLIDPDPLVLREIEDDHFRFDFWLARADKAAGTSLEREQVQEIRTGFDRYLKEFERERALVAAGGPRRDYKKLGDASPIRHVTDPCRAFLLTNETQMARAALESAELSNWLSLAMVLLSLGGPLGGLLSGFGIARGLSRSLHQLSVRVQDMAQQLDQDVGAIQLSPDGDLHHLDRQLEHVVARVTAVTQRLQRQQQEMLRAQQLAAVGQLAAGVAHEVRNPLTSIKLLVEAALRPDRPRPLTADNLGVIHREILRLEQTVQSFLEFSRPPALHRRTCDVRSVVTQVIDLLRPRARRQNVQLEAHLPEQPLLGTVDRGQLGTVLVNLLVNALDALPQGGRVDVHLRQTDEDSLEMTVLDNGPGIASEMFERLFTPFASSKPTGNGLGLSISRRVVQEHGGTLEASNRPDGGACFRITLPARLADEEHPEHLVAHCT